MEKPKNEPMNRREFMRKSTSLSLAAAATGLLAPWNAAPAARSTMGFWKPGSSIYLGPLSALATGVSGTTLTATVDIGVAAANRYVVLFIMGNTSSASYTVSSFTINGVAGLIAADQGGANGGTNFRAPAIGIAAVPTGSGLQSVSVTWSKSLVYQTAFMALPVYGLSSTTAYHSFTNSSTSATTLTGNLNTKAKALSVILGFDTDNGITHSGSGLSTLLDQDVGSANRMIIAGGFQSSTGTSSVGYTISSTATYLQVAGATFQ